LRRLVLGVLGAVLAIILGVGAIVQAKPPAIVKAKSAARRVPVAHPLSAPSSFPGTFTFRNDGFRTGQNLLETTLTPSTVKPGAFGLLFTDAVDGYVYAQPLYVPALQMPDDVHNVVFVATEFNSVYAFDADEAGPPLWHVSFNDPNNGITAVPSSDLACNDLVPWIGITATPVIDPNTPNTGTLYVLSKEKLSKPSVSYRQRLHALDITNGHEKFNGPVTISASVNGSGAGSVNGVIKFDPLKQNDRSALTLANGIVYMSFASHCDFGPYHGWILGYNASTLAPAIVFNDSPNGSDAGFWQSGCGLGIDTNGDLIAISGNGTFETSAPRVDYGDSFLRLTPGGGTLSVSSFFTPANQDFLNQVDLDLGSGGNLMLPDQPGPNPHLMVSAGKSGSIYLINRDQMGGFNTTDQVVQEISNRLGGVWSTFGYWNGNVPSAGLQNMIYTIGNNDQPKMFVISNGQIQLPPASASSVTFGYPGSSPVISANGTTGGILWAIDTGNYNLPGPAILYAFDATDLTQKLYDSSASPADNPGNAVKFANPTVANGMVYIGTANQLAAFGILPNPVPTPTATASPTATATRSATPTRTPTATASATASRTATATPTATRTATATATQTVTATATQTASATRTSTPTMSPSATTTGTAIATATRTATATTTTTPSATITATASATPTSGGIGTPTPTTTPTPSGTPSPVVNTIDVTPASISFGSQPFADSGQPSKPAKVTVTNRTGLTSVTFAATTISDGFIVTSNGCVGKLAPRATCAIAIAYAPTATGTQHGTLQINSNASGGQQSVKLTGRGFAPSLKVQPKSLKFGQILAGGGGTTRDVTLSNPSPVSITLTTAPAATPPYNVIANTCASIAANGGTCTVTVEFAPLTPGRFAGTLQIQNNAKNPQIVKLRGTAK
jgi:hypothetical protein